MSVLPISGVSSYLALTLIDRTRDETETSLRASAEHKRAIESFRTKVGKIESVDDFVEDYDSYSFVMKAFDLEDQIFGKALVKKILASDAAEKGSLINRLTDPRFAKLHEAMGFTAGGATNFNTFSAQWQEEMVDRYIDRKVINGYAEQSDTVGTALEFRDKAPGLTSWFKVLADADMGAFMRRALGVPDNAVQLDVDRQAALFAKKFDIAKLQDPAEVEKLVRKYAVLSDALSLQANAAANPVLQLFNSSGAGAYPRLFDIAAVRGVSFASLYR